MTVGPIRAGITLDEVVIDLRYTVSVSVDGIKSTDEKLEPLTAIRVPFDNWPDFTAGLKKLVDATGSKIEEGK